MTMSSVLLVEDDRTLADTIAALLPSEHRVSVAYDGESALAHATSATRTPAVVRMESSTKA